MGMKNVLVIVLVITVCIYIGSCSRGEVLTLSGISYNNNSDNFTVYLKEDGKYAPFLVLTDDYCGKALLLRQEVLEKPLRFNTYSAYYENSEIDVYLNSGYYESLEVHPRICQSVIEISDEEALGTCGETTTEITRCVFLLSCTEAGIESEVNMPLEGNRLSYFKTVENRTAQLDGQVSSWWLRTPNTYYLSCPYAIGADGKIGYGNAYDDNGIRPAFCMDAATEIAVSKDVAAGQSVYIIP